MPFKGIFAKYNILSLFFILMGLWLIVPIMVSSVGLSIAMLIWGTGNSDAAYEILLDPSPWEMTDPITLYGFRVYTIFYGIGKLLTVLIFLHLIHGNPLTRMNASRLPSGLMTLLAVLAMVAFFPVVSVAEYLNQFLELGSYLEDAGASAYLVQETMIAQPTVLELCFNLLIFVVLAALWEEWFFRGLLQPVFARVTKNAHAGVWMAAALFSAIHMQFDLFLPRMLLGAFLGYLFYFGKTIWLPVIAHMFNNLYYLVFEYMEERGIYTLPEEVSNLVIVFGTVAFTVLIFGIYRLSYSQRNLPT